MAKGGARLGAGRPKGNFSRPQIRPYFNEDEIKQLVEDIKEEAKKDPAMKRWLGEQLFGKAPQQLEVGGIDGEPLEANLSKSDRKAINELRHLLKQSSAQ